MVKASLVLLAIYMLMLSGFIYTTWTSHAQKEWDATKAEILRNESADWAKLQTELKEPH